MLNGKYVSTKTVLDELFRDNGYKLEVPWQDAVEWIYDAMELIKVPSQYIGRKARLKVTDYRTLLPCDYHNEVQVAGSFGGCYPFPMRNATNTFHPTGDQCEWDTAWRYLNDNTTGRNAQEAPIGQDIHGNPVYDLETQGHSFAINNVNSVTNNISYDDTTYKINDNYIFTNFKEGYIYMAYLAFPIDDEGYPLIPEDIRYRRAVKAYLRMKIDYLLYRTKKIERDIYEEAKQEWSWAVGSAQNYARIPSIAQMEGLKNQQVLIQNRMQYREFFKNLSR